MSVKIGMVGANGRMGQAILALAETDGRFEVAGGVDLNDEIGPVIASSDAVIEFSHFSNTMAVAEVCAAAGKPLVIGTTGHDDDLREEVLKHGATIPLIFAPNYSVGVNLLFFLAREAAARLQVGYDQEVIEMHHRHKKDAPSGTAKRLAEVLCEVKQKHYNDLTRHGRFGDVGARTDDEIGVHALRGGDVVGDHTVVFAAVGERLELTHKASSRDAFARGALEAASWLQGKPAGVYEMADVLGLQQG